MIDREGLVAGTRPELKSGQVLMTSSDQFDGYEITAYYGMVWGISVRAKDMGQDCAMGCKSITGGELESYTALSDESRQKAIDRMVEMAARQQANAIICVDFELGGSQQGATLSVVHGTACTIVPIRNYVPDGAMGNILADIADTLSKKG